MRKWKISQSDYKYRESILDLEVLTNCANTNKIVTNFHVIYYLFPLKCFNLSIRGVSKHYRLHIHARVFILGVYTSFPVWKLTRKGILGVLCTISPLSLSHSYLKWKKTPNILKNPWVLNWSKLIFFSPQAPLRLVGQYLP